MQKEYVLIELSLSAVGNYSGATYSEEVLITPQDYIKYFGSGQDTDAETFEEFVESEWQGKEIYVGELDGKHSEVSGDVDVEFWDAEEITEYWEEPSNDGNRLIYEIAHMAEMSSNESSIDIINNIKSHVKELVESIGTKVTIECRVPKDKVDELREFVKQLNK